MTTFRCCVCLERKDERKLFLVCENDDLCNDQSCINTYAARMLVSSPRLSCSDDVFHEACRDVVEYAKRKGESLSSAVEVRAFDPVTQA